MVEGHNRTTGQDMGSIPTVKKCKAFRIQRKIENGSILIIDSQDHFACAICGIQPRSCVLFHILVHVLENNPLREYNMKLEHRIEEIQ